MEPSKKNTLPIEGKKGEIILYQPDESISNRSTSSSAGSGRSLNNSSPPARLILIDPFVDERTLLLLDKRTNGIECTVHTRYN